MAEQIGVARHVVWLGEAEGDHAVLFHLQHHVLTPHWCDSALPRCLARYAWAPSMASRNSCSPLESVASLERG